MKTSNMLFRLIMAAVILCAVSSYADQGEDGEMEPPADVKAKLIEKFDADGDGELNDEERAAAKEYRKEMRDKHRARMLEKFDTDGDGELSDEERAVARDSRKKGPAKTHKRMLQKYDVDEDGVLNEEELAAAKADRAKRGQDE